MTNDEANRLLGGAMSRRHFLRSASIAAALPTLMTGALIGPARAQSAKLGTLVVAIQEGDTRTLDPQGANELTVPIFLRRTTTSF